MQNPSQNGTKQRASGKHTRRTVAIIPQVASHLDGYLVHAQGKDVADGKPIKDKQYYYSAAMRLGMEANGYQFSQEEEVQNV